MTLVKKLPKKKDKGSSKSTAPLPSLTKAASASAAHRKRKHEGDAESVEKNEEDVQKKAKKLKGKEKENAQKAPKPQEVKTKVDKSEKRSPRGGKADLKAKSPKPIKKFDEKKATGKKDLTTRLPKKHADSEMKKRKRLPTPSPEPSDADADEDDNAEDGAENEEEDELSEGFATNDHADESDEEQQSEEGSGSHEGQHANEDGSENEDGAADEDEEALLHGFSSGSDSSDEDEVEKAPIDVGKLPTVAKDDATVKRKLERAKKQETEQRGVVYLSRIPHGFYEDQMKSYFSQFGEVTRLRLSRNKKTGKSKHYAFIEFKSAAVAQIVAETMDNYLLMGHLLQCKLIPKEKVHPELWIGSNRKFRKVPAARLERLQQNKRRTNTQRNNVEKRLLKRQEQKKRKLEALGIDYDMGPVLYSRRDKQVMSYEYKRHGNTAHELRIRDKKLYGHRWNLAAFEKVAANWNNAAMIFLQQQ